MNSTELNIVDLISQTVSIPSVSPREDRLTAWYKQCLIAQDFTVSENVVEEDRRNVFAQKGSGTKAILFYGHIDTVGVVQPNEWQSDPFALTKVGDKLFGLGTYDMKGGIAAILHAVSQTEAYVKVFLAVDEENISSGAWSALEQKREFFEDVELVISAEPNFNLGLNGITTGRTGRVIFEAIFNGSPAHLAEYRNAVDAIELFTNFSKELYTNRDQLGNSDKTAIQIRKIEAEATGMSVCGSAKAEIEVLLGPEDSIESIHNKLEQLGFVTISLKPRPTPYLTGYNFTSFPHQRQIADIIKHTTGNQLTTHFRSSVGDDNVLATLGIPVITWGPDGGNAHKPNEWVSLKSLETLSHMYRQLLHNL